MADAPTITDQKIRRMERRAEKGLFLFLYQYLSKKGGGERVLEYNKKKIKKNI